VPTQVLERDPLTERLLAVIRTVYPADQARVPDEARLVNEDEELEEFQPYVILYALEARWTGPPMQPWSCATMPYQLTAVGATGHHSLLVADRVRATLLGGAGGDAWTTSLDVTGLHVVDRRTVSPGVSDADASLHSVPETYEFDVEAA
jgi:hypothetical protein